MNTPTALQPILKMARIDFRPNASLPSPMRLVVATFVALIGSLLADAALAAIGVALFPTTKGYDPFQFGSYSTLTILGVLAACIAWPVTTRISSSSRWLFVRMAVVVTAVLLLPDVWLIIQNNPAKAVAVLVAMHLAIAVVTYNSLVRIAPATLQPNQTGWHLDGTSRVRGTTAIDNE